MALHNDKPKRKPRVIRSKNKLTPEFIDECIALQERILKRRGGELLPRSVDDIREMREERMR